ncbi:MAG: glutamate-5-semialdehyde dehydrogenase [Candidatus Promineofilum sp.]|nr:glutamate-5-semialdehyde dehydrogenase [Promineifilum sp.]
MTDLNTMGIAARAAARQLATLTTARKNDALRAIADELEARGGAALEANIRDIADARAAGQSAAILDRLLLDERRLAELAADARRVADLPDPVGEELESRLLPNGIRLVRRRTPIGVIGVIYEARPNVTIDIATLCLKTGNAAILRGGRETLRTNLALVEIIGAALARCGLPPAAVQAIADPDRALVTELLHLDRYVDMIIPRGGAALHRLCREQSRIPVITGGLGICHIYVDESADLERAVDIIENAKVQRPSVCNALDTLLVHPAVAGQLLPAVARRLAGHGVELRAADNALPYLSDVAGGAPVTPAGPDDFDTEWMALILGIKLVGGLDEAIDHIQAHSTEHTDVILTNDLGHATRFVNEVTSSAVFVNASTRFNDGGQFGLGAEVAVSTQKLHARGPMGLEALTTYKWIGYGSGQIRN